MDDYETHSPNEPVDGWRRDDHWPKAVLGDSPQEDQLVCGKHPDKNWVFPT